MQSACERNRGTTMGHFKVQSATEPAHITDDSEAYADAATTSKTIGQRLQARRAEQTIRSDTQKVLGCKNGEKKFRHCSAITFFLYSMCQI